MRLIYVAVVLLICFGVLSSNKAEAISCRKQSVKHRFDVSQGYPKGRTGYIVDHTCALACGGKDIISNMQYQTFAESKTKDKWEFSVIGCKQTCNASNSTPTRQVFNCR